MPDWLSEERLSGMWEGMMIDYLAGWSGETSGVASSLGETDKQVLSAEQYDVSDELST